MQCFNPHPTFRPDATQGSRGQPAYHLRFQPSSDLQAGCNVDDYIDGLTLALFQPSSDLQAGCNGLAGDVGLLQPVAVSTLIRPSGRMQPGPVTSAALTTTFQPSSDLQAGCNQAGCNNAPMMASRYFQTFQPSSDLQAGCNGRAGQCDVQCFLVSTLIRPSGRMQPTAWSSSSCPGTCFNPHPTFRPDATPVPGFPIGSSRTSSTMPHDGHFWDEMFKRLTRAATRTRTSSVRGRQQWVRVTPRGGRRSRPRCPARIPRLVGPGCRAACKTGCCPASRR